METKIGDDGAIHGARGGSGRSIVAYCSRWLSGFFENAHVMPLKPLMRGRAAMADSIESNSTNAAQEERDETVGMRNKSERSKPHRPALIIRCMRSCSACAFRLTYPLSLGINHKFRIFERSLEAVDQQRIQLCTRTQRKTETETEQKKKPVSKTVSNARATTHGERE